MGAVLAALFLEPGAPLHDDETNSLDASARTELILNSVYNDLQQRHARDREKFEQGSRAVPTRVWNQQEVYLDCEKRTRARAASRKFLERHRDWLSGPTKVGDVALHDLVAVQHYIDLDLEDLSLPESERRNSDSFGGPDGNICEPFLQDATRCSISVDGRRFSFPARCAARGLAISKDPAALQMVRQAFIADLTSAVLRSLNRSGPPPPNLVRAVTSAMSQSGLASVERACYSSQVVVSGGDQTVQYRLQSLADNAYDVTLSVHKVRFQECIVCSQFFEDPVTVPCSPKSFVKKACTIRFSVLGDGSGIQADVVKLRKEMCLVNVYGALLTGHALGGAGRQLSSKFEASMQGPTQALEAEESSEAIDDEVDGTTSTRFAAEQQIIEDE
mmetsp:Transcript_54388/g.174401  ORF Transcript_54388/g.174401 Transcript_54388/m.174401 type:complete len:389 (+) Transcript_54388:61-1227(+)